MKNMTNSYNQKAIVFIDSTVTDYQSLVAGVNASSEVVILDRTKDSISQITEVLANRSNISAVHIVSHGSPGSLQLGNGSLNTENIEDYGTQLQQWRKSFSNKADILIYGCNVAANNNQRQGKIFLQRLHELTGANIAASDDLTGNAALGGDWDLEVTIGKVASSIVFHPAIAKAYSGVLAPNDNFIDAITITGTSITTTGDNIGATGEVGEPNFFGTNAVWWNWTAPVNPLSLSIGNVSLTEGNSGTTNAIFTTNLSGVSSYQVTVDTIGSNFDTTLGIYTGSAVNSLTVIGQSDDALGFVGPSRVIFSATPGTTYQIAVGGFSSAQGSINLNLNATPTTNPTVTVNYATADGTATTANNDYQSTTGTLTFNPGTTSQTITVPINGDTVLETDETFTVNLSNPVNAGLTNNSATGTIVNDEVAISLSNPTVQNEGNSGNVNYNFTVSLNIPSTQIVGVNYNTSDGTATTADSDYTSTSGNLIFNPGETQKTITVVANGDNKYEQTETFNLNLLTPINASILNSTAVGTIANDDAFPTIAIADVSQNEGQSGTSNFIFTVTLSNPSYQTVSVSYATSNGISTAGTDYNTTSGTLTFNPGETQKTFTVGVIGNTTVENNKNFLVNLSNVSNATIADNQAVGTILNDDGVPTVNNITKTGNEDTTIAFTATDFSSKFTDPNGDSLNKIKINSLPNNGILQLSSSNVTVNQEISVNDLGNLRFIPTADWNGNTSFNWIGSDGANYVQNPAAVNLTIIPVNDAPFVNLQIPRQSANANNLFNFTFAGDTFKDIDVGDNLTYSATLANGNPLPNWLFFNSFTRTFVGTPTNSNEETIVLLVKATDSGNATATTSFSLLVNSSNLPLPQPTPGLEDCFCDSFVRPDINNLTGVSVAKNPVDNTLVGTNGKDTLIGTAVNEELSGLDDDDLLIGNAGVDNLIGNQGNDIVFGGSDRDWISGNEGDDVLNGNEGDDVLNGNQGNDSVRGGQGNDFVSGGQNDDLIYGDRGNDTLGGDNGNDTIFGDRNDTSNSLVEKDLIFGGSGDDLINGNAGNDTIFGEDGNDKVRGGKDDDILFGDAGNDLLYGDLGNDSLCGGDGNDTMYGGNGSPTSANGDRDELCGGADNDLLFGNEADDKLNGEDGDDTLYGGKDNDTLIGGNGNDYLSGDLGNDLLIGGSGNDRFILTSGKGNDIVDDFQDGKDLIALSGGLTFADLAIAQSGNNTIVSVQSSNELLATLNGIQASLITQQDFTLV